MANGHGGKRANAGNKSGRTRLYQAARRKDFEKGVTAADWQEIIAMAVLQSKNGNDKARDWLTPWIVGKPPEDVDPEQAVGFLLKMVDALKGTDGSSS